MAKPLERATDRAPCKLNNEKHVEKHLGQFFKTKVVFDANQRTANGNS